MARDSRGSLIDRFVALQPNLRQRFAMELPDGIRDQLGSATLHQLEALKLIAEGGDMSVGDLAARLRATSVSTATQMADRLEKLGLLTRVHDPDDRRVVRLSLTDTARTLIAEFNAAHRRTIENLLGTLTDEEVSALVALLERLAQPISSST